MASDQTDNCADASSAGLLIASSPRRSASRARRATSYVLGSSPAELYRLTLQAMILQPITERLFREAGVAEGMTVLDLGCGPGDVSFLAAELVGPSGWVIGIDQAPEAIALAKQRAREKGVRNVDFEQTKIDEFSPLGRFDAVVGRYILLHQPDPAAFLRRVARFARPNGVLALHEFSLRHRFRSFPTVPLWDRAGDWLIAAFKPDDPGRDAATRLVEHFVAAGLRRPALFAEIPIGSGESSPLYAWVAETIQSMLPAVVASGAATAEDVSIATLEERLRAAVVAANAHIEVVAQICGWARLSGAADEAATTCAKPGAVDWFVDSIGQTSGSTISASE